MVHHPRLSRDSARPPRRERQLAVRRPEQNTRASPASQRFEPSLYIAGYAPRRYFPGVDVILSMASDSDVGHHAIDVCLFPDAVAEHEEIRCCFTIPEQIEQRWRQVRTGP